MTSTRYRRTISAWRCYLAVAFAEMSAGQAAASDNFTSAVVSQGESRMVSSSFLSICYSADEQRVFALSVDSLGTGKLDGNLLLNPAQHLSGSQRGWSIEPGEKKIVLRSRALDGLESSAPFVLLFDARQSRATLLGSGMAREGDVELPCVLHVPDHGSMRITCAVADAKIGYDASRWKDPPFTRIEFPAATPEHSEITYEMEVVAIYPHEIGPDPVYEAARRNWLNIFQVSSHLRMLANNSASDPCPFILYQYAEFASRAPVSCGNVTTLGLVKATLDQYLSGQKGYGQIGYPTPGERGTHAEMIPWRSEYEALDAVPSLLLAACNYVMTSRDWEWARKNYRNLSRWADEIIAADRDGNGLIEYLRTGNSGDDLTIKNRPANWWDTIGFGHEDAYSNALAYRAAQLFAEVSIRLGKASEATKYQDFARKLRAAYVPVFLNPATGVLAGWKSADGRLHDYYFTFVNGIAISFGLVDPPEANRIMDRLLGKMHQVGFTAFEYGLPGNLIPIRRDDYVKHGKANHVLSGEPDLEDGSDAFQNYENGGATPCHTYWTIKALYSLGRVEDARQILYPMLHTYATGGFQGFDESGKSGEWRNWSGKRFGYEGFLADAYLPLLAVLDDIEAKSK